MPFVSTDDGYQLFYEEHGNGIPIVFVHQFGDDYRSWANQIDCFSENYRCITYSARGFNPSSIPSAVSDYGQTHSTNDLLTLLNELGLESVHLIGCSMGSFTSLDFALNYPDRVISLTLVGNSSGPRDDAERDGYRNDWVEPEIQRRQAEEEQGGIAILEEDPAYQRLRLENPDEWKRYANHLSEQSDAGAINILRTVHWNRRSIWQDKARLSAFEKPVLLAFGDEDYYLVGETSRFLHETLPNS
jgi:3-oxoadipate enol-lactonase